MNHRLRNLAERRELLVTKASMQRLKLTQNIETWNTPLELIDRGISIVTYIKQHPAWVASSSLAALTFVRPNRVGKWFRRGWIVWQILRKFRN